jgi:radical SAM protein with 4Fe4S-binding SPASM domain
MKRLPVVTSYRAIQPRNQDGLSKVELDLAHSPIKVLAHADLLRRFVRGSDIHPIHMRIGIIGACNMRCNFCNFHSSNEVHFYDLFSFKDMIPTANCIELMQQFAESGGRAVTFCGSGECTTHPGYVEICQAAHAAGLKIGLITNGSRVDRPDVARCIVETHTWVRIGLNAGTAETFGKITHYDPGGYATILGAVSWLREHAKDSQFRVGLNFVITAENYEEILSAAQAAKASGAHYIRYEPEFYTALGHDTVKDHYRVVCTALDEAAKLASDEFEISVPKLDRGPMDCTDSIEGEFSRCHYSRFVTAVGADGNLYPCPQVHLNSRYKIGNVIDDGYLDVLEGGAREEWEKSNPLRTDLCKTCFYRPQNELLEKLASGAMDSESALSTYAIEVPRTLHADFV